MPPSAPGSGDRFKLNLTDGTATIMGMLSGQMKPMIESGEIREFTLIRLQETMVNDVNGKKYVFFFSYFLFYFRSMYCNK